MLGQAVGSSESNSPRPPHRAEATRYGWTAASGNATLAPHSLLACVGYGCGSRCQANAAVVPAYSGQGRSFYRRWPPSANAAALPARLRAVPRPSTPNEFAWKAALQGGLPGELTSPRPSPTNPARDRSMQDRALTAE